MPTTPERDPALSSLLFPSASRSISSFARESTRSRLSIRSRLASISADARFVTSVRDATRSTDRAAGLPLVANERCGSWYVSPSEKGGSVYFKSTDGHFGQWAFSGRRLNVHLFPLIEEHGGCIIVDSTRRGKSIPDALSKTIPIWAAVWNERLVSPEKADFRTPDAAVSPSEHAQISARLPQWTEELRNLDIQAPKLGRPLRSIWVSRSSLGRLAEEVASAQEAGCYPLVLCTASGRDVAPEDELLDGCEYVQGAADDAEAWARGLTPEVFWRHSEELLGCDEDGLPGLIGRLLEQENVGSRSARAPVQVMPVGSMFIGTEVHDGGTQGWDLVVDLRPHAKAQTNGEMSPGTAHSEKRKYIRQPLEAGKLGSRSLRKGLGSILEAVDQVLAANADAKVLVICSTGKDHSVGVALAILSLYASDEGHMLSVRRQEGINKDLIKRRLGWIMISIADANPSRATLQSVNAVLLE